jgi:hypothetical protein
MHRRVGFALLITLAVALSACGGTSTPSLLTQSDVPSNLGVKSDPSAAATLERQDKSPPACKKAGTAVFGPHPLSTHLPTSLLVVNVDWSCTSPSTTKKAFDIFLKQLGGRMVPGIGNEAALANTGGDAEFERSFTVDWYENTRVGALIIQGGPKDKRITPALAELLARRAAG